MNEDYNSIEPGTDLGLGLGYSEQHSQGVLTRRSGVGANAGSMVDMKYVATDSLSELVWSPHKGLSLRCADSSFNNRKSSVIWDAGLNNASFIIPLQAEIPLKNISDSKDNLNMTSSGDTGPMTSKVKMDAQERGMKIDWEETDSRVEFPAVCSKQNEDPRESGVDITEAAHIHVDEVPANRNFKEDEAHINKLNEVSMEQDEPELGKMPHELLVMDAVDGDSESDENIGSLAVGKNVIHPLDECKPSGSQPTILGKLESAAENDLQNINDETGGGEGSKILVTESTHEVRGSNQPDETHNCKDRGESASPPNRRMHWKRREGKEKALSDGYINGRMSIDEDKSFGSVESCSSAFLSTCKRRWSFEQQLVVGSKRVKKQDDNTPGPRSNSGLDSSFMSWMSNMMRGSSQPIQDDAPSLDLTLAKPDIKHGDPSEEPVTYKKSHDPGFNSMGFQSIFRSLYGPITRGVEGGLNADCQAKQGSKDIEVINRSYEANATPIDCFGESDNFGKQLLLVNQNVTEFTSGKGPTPLIQLKNSSEVSSGSHQSHKTKSQERRNSGNLVIGNKIGEVMSNSTSGKCKSNSTENVDNDLPPIKVNYNIGNTSDPFRSLWITRFAAKTSGLMLNPESCNQNTKDDSQCSMLGPRLIPCPQNQVDFHHSTEDSDTAASKEQCYSANTEASSGHKEFRSHNEQKSITKFNPALPPPSLRSSEAIASTFARRLGAFKHIVPLDVTENAGHETVTCFFCGTRGHLLQDCSEITEREVKDLSRNISLFNEAGEFSCLCIRCFQHNHWAIACPIAASSGQHQSEPCASLADHCDTGETQVNSGIGLNAKSQFVEKRKMELVASTLDDKDDPNVEADLSLRLDCKVSKEIGSAVVSILQCVTSRVPEISSKESEMVLVDSLVDKQKNSDGIQLVINAVKTLRLSRNDILKCMNSHVSLSHLDGFFVRIRLGKWEEGLGGTGYHVACIRGSQLAKNSISVIVRGIECQVQSRYISNHDFLEDELMAWWCAGTKDSSKIIPLAEDFRAKVKKRRQLGF